jgi:hypothetical protein
MFMHGYVRWSGVQLDDPLVRLCGEFDRKGDIGVSPLFSVFHRLIEYARGVRSVLDADPDSGSAPDLDSRDGCSS